MQTGVGLMDVKQDRRQVVEAEGRLHRKALHLCPLVLLQAKLWLSIGKLN